MLELNEIKLTRVRRIADQADDGFLVYLIDMAIIASKHSSHAQRSALAEDAANAHSLRRESGEQGRPDA